MEKQKDISMKPGFSKILNTNAKSIGCLSNNTISSGCRTVGFTDLVVGIHQQLNDASSILGKQAPNDKNNSLFLCYLGSIQSRYRSTRLDKFQTSSISDKMIACQDIKWNLIPPHYKYYLKNALSSRDGWHHYHKTLMVIIYIPNIALI